MINHVTTSVDYLNYEDTVNLCSTSRQYRDMCSKKSFWVDKAYRVYGVPPSLFDAGVPYIYGVVDGRELHTPMQKYYGIEKIFTSEPRDLFTRSGLYNSPWDDLVAWHLFGVTQEDADEIRSFLMEKNKDSMFRLKESVSSFLNSVASETALGDRLDARDIPPVLFNNYIIRYGMNAWFMQNREPISQALQTLLRRMLVEIDPLDRRDLIINTILTMRKNRDDAGVAAFLHAIYVREEPDIIRAALDGVAAHNASKEYILSVINQFIFMIDSHLPFTEDNPMFEERTPYAEIAALPLDDFRLVAEVAELTEDDLYLIFKAIIESYYNYNIYWVNPDVVDYIANIVGDPNDFVPRIIDAIEGEYDPTSLF